ncbi:MAG: exodeoxyribonuclease VII small subunit [Chromatiales bacterium 21-64-14]|nr:MAG: exodeoxyribonuclease VII small subunit [Chromatiales bacterium 21-64-14]HQU15561.1 exodeoxyribonuclease VII small subunit [Gammaproteobacteria bacterium]
MVKKSAVPLDFEHALKELEALVLQMEQGELTLEQSLKYFERGIELTRACQRALKEADQKVEQLVQAEGHSEVVPFSSEE